MSTHDKKPASRETRPCSGGEMVPLNDFTHVIFALEELEKRLEMQRMPLDLAAACQIQEPGCYADGCEGEYCYDLCNQNSCADLCYCDDGRCEPFCAPKCALYCHIECVGDDVCAGELY